ncbi:MlaA family lipoprotein [Alteromonas sp. ASW11-130]|uniref:MlaA family lipoprotein n=1 Tax=Alteromonas sp. ASW11-130 TaxID=3015775 RepID=UPI0022427719|nr:VacJ family lipoprotein [Alteromonas sp. ASW11-130]MCW8090293.1 VacJ family lipoprotein [Alteromonas sp. ASW11-130]
MHLLRQGLINIFIVALLGCASPSEPEQLSPPQEQSSQPNQNRQVNELSQGKTVTITTSQGEVRVEPTVVAVTDAQRKESVDKEKYYHDPWEGFNRTMFGFNHAVYEHVLIPTTNGYRYVVPEVVRDKIGNAFDNIREPLNFINNVFAGELEAAGNNVGRFLINSTIGLLGLFDPATDWFAITEKKQTIADTLRRYDISPGPYLVLPILGPSDVRGGFSTLTEGFLHPINQITEPPESYQLRTFDGFDDFSNQSETYQQIYNSASDPYIYFRNQYIQGQRRDELFKYQEKQNDE